ncbi:putative endonuclease [Methylobacillus rhizosphaerae]|uniref:UPF0102 protein SAMN05192560_0285 n=1 Tax=Methylobacillus rhizosphaerae TaxID=551994 RepID=A0A238XXT8_9PROT|nr:YraN family protein [Methylobacillus rhizosphaerae]SNR63727.1 putative endonuclease [Methylobacillus rhizosphaerae]
MKQIGDNAEIIAGRYLESHGLRLINRNYRCRFGEIDLIMQQGDIIVFIEVRMRSHLQFGGAAASITPSKQQKLIRTAEHFLQQHGNTACRFDAILMNKLDTDQIEWITNAFSA